MNGEWALCRADRKRRSWYGLSENGRATLDPDELLFKHVMFSERTDPRPKVGSMQSPDPTEPSMQRRTSREPNHQLPLPFFLTVLIDIVEGYQKR